MSAFRLTLFIALIAAADSFAQPPTTQPARPAVEPKPQQPANPAGDQKPSSGDKLVDEVLDRLEARGKTAKAIESKIEYKYITPGPIEGLENEQRKEGTLFFAQTGRPRFLVNFTKKVQDDIVERTPEFYGFDGYWLTERNDGPKTIICRQIVRPGDDADLFDLGRGPFPLPFGRSRAEMLKHFEIHRESTHIGDDKSKPVQLRCLPRPGTDLVNRYRYVDLFVDRTLDLPTRVVCLRRADENRVEVSFNDIREHDTIDASRFEVPRPPGFQLTVEPLDEGALPPD